MERQTGRRAWSVAGGWRDGEARSAEWAGYKKVLLDPVTFWGGAARRVS